MHVCIRTLVSNLSPFKQTVRVFHTDFTHFRCIVHSSFCWLRWRKMQTFSHEFSSGRCAFSVGVSATLPPWAVSSRGNDTSCVAPSWSWKWQKVTPVVTPAKAWEDTQVGLHSLLSFHHFAIPLVWPVIRTFYNPPDPTGRVVGVAYLQGNLSQLPDVWSSSSVVCSAASDGTVRAWTVQKVSAASSLLTANMLKWV